MFPHLIVLLGISILRWFHRGKTTGNDWNLLISEKVVGSPVPSPAAYGNPPVPSGRIPPAPGQILLFWDISDSDCVVLMFLSYSQGLTKALNWDYSILSHDTY